MPFRSALLAFALAFTPGPALLATVEFRREPSAAERVGNLLLDAKGNRVLADSLARADFVLLFRGSDQDAAARDLARTVARVAESAGVRLEVVVLEARASRTDLLRLLRTPGTHWYGVDPAAPAAPALAALFPEAGDPAQPALALLAARGDLLAVSGADLDPAQVLRELERRLAAATQRPAEQAAQQRDALRARRAELARQLQADPARADAALMRELFPVEGLLKVGGTQHAMIDQKVVGVGGLLPGGARVVAIEPPHVIVEAGGRRFTLAPAAIPGGGRP
jgi:hypothetical protein